MNFKLMLTGVGAFVLGLAVQGLHAQMKPPAYVVGEITVKDENGYKNEFLRQRSQSSPNLAASMSLAVQQDCVV